MTSLEGKNIVLLVMDTASAFNMPMYGYDRETTPFLQDLAEDNCFVKYAYANGAWTPPSHASIFSGKFPHEHGCTTENLYFDANSFVEDLSEDGYTTYGFTNNKALSAENNFDKGFDQWISGKNEIVVQQKEDVPALKEFVEKEENRDYGDRQKYIDFLIDCIRYRDLTSLRIGLHHLYRRMTDPGHVDLPEDSGADATNKLVEETVTDEPFFLFINYIEPHTRLNPPKEIAQRWMKDYSHSLKQYVKEIVNTPLETVFLEDHDERLIHDVRGLYDASIVYLDQKVKELYEQVNEDHEDVVFIITSDHGENLGHYDGCWDHQFGLWERLMRVPLIIAGDDIPDITIDRQVSLHELHDLVLGEKDIEDLGTETIFAEYRGSGKANDSDLSQYAEEELYYLQNTSKAVVQDGTGYILHSNLDDFVFTSSMDGCKETSEQRDKHAALKHTIKKNLVDETAGVDI
jgi:arylsulfatase A-like enzyme